MRPRLTWLVKLVDVAVSSSVRNTISPHPKTPELTGKSGVDRHFAYPRMFSLYALVLVAGNELYSKAGNWWFPFCGEVHWDPLQVLGTVAVFVIFGLIIVGIVYKKVVEYKRRRGGVATTSASQSVPPNTTPTTFWSPEKKDFHESKVFSGNDRQNICRLLWYSNNHYSDVIMSAMAPQITGNSMVYSTVCSGADQRKHKKSASLAFVRGTHRWPANSPHKRPVTRKMFPFDDVIMSFETN